LGSGLQDLTPRLGVFASAGLILIHLLFQAVWLEEQDGLLKWIVFGSLAVPAAWTRERSEALSRTRH
jgi:hypothetical protein